MPDFAESQLRRSIVVQFGAPLVSYISGVEVDEADTFTDEIPGNLVLALEKLNELRIEAAVRGQDLPSLVSWAALGGLFEEMRRDLGGQLFELKSDDPVVQSLRFVLCGLSTLMLTAPYLYAGTSFPLGFAMVSVFDKEVASAFRQSLEADPALRGLIISERDSYNDSEDNKLYNELRSDFAASSFLQSLLSSCYITARFRRTTSLLEIGVVARELLDSAREACSTGYANVSYFSVIKDIGLAAGFEWKNLYFYQLTDLYHDILRPENRPAIGGDSGQIMAFALEVRHRRQYVKGADPASGALTSNALPEDAVGLERQLQSVPLAIALATGHAGRRVWAAVADPRHGALPFSSSADRPVSYGGLLDASSQREIIHWLNLLDELSRTKLNVAEHRLMSALSERSQPADQLIDAVIVWEALFGGDVELSFRISMGMAFLIGAEPEEIESIRKQCLRLYTARSKLVHGSSGADNPAITENADQATDLALRAMRAIYRDAPELIKVESKERTRTAISRRMASP